MEWLVNAKEMKYCDNNTITHFGMPAMVLMERAALKVASYLEQNNCDTSKVLIVCGTGNNGGDGLAIARLLHLQHITVEIVLAGEKSKMTKETKAQLEICQKYLAERSEGDLQLVIGSEISRRDYTLVIDALLGIGVSRNLEGNYFELITQMNELSGYKVAVDIPSGISADNGAVMGTAFRADATVTFGYQKLGLVLNPGASWAGEVQVADIGIEEHSWLDKKPGVSALNKTDLAGLLKRAPDGNKGTFGKVLVIGGTINMAGAAYFTAKAAYKSGCGLVRIYTTEENRTILQTKLPEAILTTYSGKKADLQQLNDALAWADVIVVGPGLGTDENAHTILKNTLKNAAVPLVADADALNIIAEDTQILLKPHTEMIVTPHMGEMARLSGLSVSYLKENRFSAAEEFAREYNVICVLKDARTVTAVPYGRTYLNLSGNDGMATGGSGDVLAGIIGGLVAQGIHPEIASSLGVFWHGMAGDEASQKVGKHGVMAETIIEHLAWQ